jgi:iron transport multicopper oxidase
LNDGVKSVLKVEPNKIYMLRIVSLAAFAQAYIWIEDHEFQIVEIDGIYTEPQNVDSIYLATAQRYSVLITTKPTAAQNYAINAMMDDNDFDSVPDYVNQNTTATLEYSSALPNCEEGTLKYSFDNFDEFNLVPYDQMPALTGKPDHSFVMNISFFEQDNQNRAGFNDVTYISQKVPTLYSVLTSGKTALNSEIYGVNTNTMLVHYNDLVEIVINNFDSGYHNIHLHGHAVQLVTKQENVTDFGGNGTAAAYSGDTSVFPKYPARRDTWLNAPYGYTVIRFRATNPGVWLFHCHMEWHVDAGLVATLIEAPLKIQGHQTMDPVMAAMCEAQGVLIAGNAGGNTENLYNLTNAVTTCMPNPMGALVG